MWHQNIFRVLQGIFDNMKKENLFGLNFRTHFGTDIQLAHDASLIQDQISLIEVQLPVEVSLSRSSKYQGVNDRIGGSMSIHANLTSCKLDLTE